MLNRQRSWHDGEFEMRLVRGIAAAKAGQREEAKRFLRAALQLKDTDARPWLWLTATTDDRAQKRDFLEHALACDPTNQAARRGLVALSGEAGPLRPIGAASDHSGPDAPAAATSARLFTCPQCGGRTYYDPQAVATRCERCGSEASVEQVEAAADAHERPLDVVLPTDRAHRWAAAEHALSCTQCGALNVLPPKQRRAVCAFCGSDHLVTSTHTAELIEPQAVLPMQLDEAQARERLARWLGKGWLRPGGLAKRARRIDLRPAYYPVWTFDATYHARWWAYVRRNDKEPWQRREGEAALFFDDVLVPGTSCLSLEALHAAAPFDLAQRVEFREDFLAGWPTLLPDRSLADASIVARGVMSEAARGKLEDKTLLEYEKKNFTVVPQGLSDATYRPLLLPLWRGTLRYEGHDHEIVINGQTGNVGGEKPRSPARIAFLVTSSLVLLLGLVAVALIVWQG